MTITSLTIFASAGEKNTTGLALADGFPAAQKPARQWFNWLFNTLTAKINEIITATNAQAGREAYAVGDLYLTTIAHADASAVATFHGYGTWARHAEGRALVGLSDNAPDPTWTKTIGSAPGEYEHTLTVDEMPKHKHSTAPYDKFTVRSDDAEAAGDTYDAGGGGYGLTVTTGDLNHGDTEIQVADISPVQWAKMTEAERGGDQPFSIVQPSIVIGVWRRTA